MLFSLAGLVLAISGGVIRHAARTAGTATNFTFLYIKPGDGLLVVANSALKAGLVNRAWHFSVTAKQKNLETKLKAGEYRIQPGQRVQDLLQTIVAGKSHYRRLIVTEGVSVAQLELQMTETGMFSWRDYKSPDEGSLLPETYFYTRGGTASASIQRMQDAMGGLLDALWEQRDATLPFKTKEEALILASIVEKETGVSSERPLVAAVFVNRLKKKMRLQSDPTVVYGITYGSPLGRPLKRKELREQTAYNTYRIAGLPPTPIANPGRAALEAVFNPAKVSFLYFVADGTGGHAFAKTLREHNQNVARWRKFQAESR